MSCAKMVYRQCKPVAYNFKEEMQMVPKMG